MMTPGFAYCLMQTAAHPGLVANFDRLRGTNLSRRGSPLDLMIDDASGRLDGDVAAFAAFVRDCVWDRLPPDVRAELEAEAVE